MQPRTRLVLQIFGGLTVAAAAAVWLMNRTGLGIADPTASVRGGSLLDTILGRANPDASLRGEEVYASHDCTDCHLAVHVLRQKRDKKEVGLIRVRRDFDILQKFLETDQRHQSYVMVSEKDRRDLVEYLRTLIVQ